MVHPQNMVQCHMFVHYLMHVALLVVSSNICSSIARIPPDNRTPAPALSPGLVLPLRLLIGLNILSVLNNAIRLTSMFAGSSGAYPAGRESRHAKHICKAQRCKRAYNALTHGELETMIVSFNSHLLDNRLPKHRGCTDVEDVSFC